MVGFAHNQIELVRGLRIPLVLILHILFVEIGGMQCLWSQLIYGGLAHVQIISYILRYRSRLTETSHIGHRKYSAEESDTLQRFNILLKTRHTFGYPPPHPTPPPSLDTTADEIGRAGNF